MSLDLRGMSDKDLAMDWVLQQKASSDVTFQARDDRPVPLQQPNAEQQFAVFFAPGLVPRVGCSKV
jgi:hypothetical protein